MTIRTVVAQCASAVLIAALSARNGVGYAQLVAGMYEAHSAGRMDIESEFSEVRRGSSCLAEAFATLLLEHE